MRRHPSANVQLPRTSRIAVRRIAVPIPVRRRGCVIEVHVTAVAASAVPDVPITDALLAFDGAASIPIALNSAASIPIALDACGSLTAIAAGAALTALGHYPLPISSGRISPARPVSAQSTRADMGVGSKFTSITFAPAERANGTRPAAG